LLGGAPSSLLMLQQQQLQQQQQQEDGAGLHTVLAQLLTDPKQQQQQQQVVYGVLGSARSTKVLQQYWAGLLKARVGTILSDAGMAGGGRGLSDDDPLDHLT
jgi:hypothetical protein